MASRRTSFHSQPLTDEVITANGDQAQRINFLIQCVPALTESPELSYQEWMTIVAAANGYVANYPTGLDAVLHSFATGIAYADIFGAEFDSIDKEMVARKFWALPKNQQLFAFELARKFWLPAPKLTNSYQQWLSENGAEIVQ